MEVKDPAKLRRERKQKRYTQRELGMLVRRTQTTIYKLETGQLKNITEDLALAIAARLDCHWEDLFVAHEEEAAPVVSSVSNDKVSA
ncbi:helix-turn-helix DNA binding domain protein [Gordonia phage Dolores]|uniref:Helix-turn-helix DNA binding domain protein n=1 Tax=Gordonia phage Dolores TaxID=2873534 RepID=A0AAE9BM42_9CAUD|nr:helix-turn-helix DNA binding domain protein [Gordonia phage Dolores]UAJ16476.1 helix-turn-helix DNA binding domain protein [Gordonia phage Dolores]URM87944.1 helix-turn-helix DNA-binding domain protein [Gordonia phage WinkNick]UTN93558.1 Cro protein [Gordonia phage Oregano]